MGDQVKIFVLSILIGVGCTSQRDPYVLPEEGEITLEELARFPSFTEGIVFDENGNAYVSELKGGLVYKMTPAGSVEPWVSMERPNGHKIRADGTHLVCDAEQKAVVLISPEGEILAKRFDQFDGRPINGPNDIALDENGRGFYFTDPEGSWTDNPVGAVYYVDENDDMSLLVDTLAYPNGVVLDAEKNRLFVSESGLNRILVFPLLTPGIVGPAEVFIDLPKSTLEDYFFAPDGMIVDESGNLFVAHFGMESILVINPSGQIIRSYKTGIAGPTNVVMRELNGSRAMYVTGAVSHPDSLSEGALVRLAF